MATVSGTFAQERFETRKIIDEAFSLCRLPEQAITSEMIERALDNLWLMLSSMQAQFRPLWTQDRQVLGLTEGEMALDTPPGTIDVISASLRTLNLLAGTDATAADSLTRDLGSVQVVASVGFTLASVEAAIVVETSEDGVAFTPRLALPAAAYASGAAVWRDLDPTVAARFVRLREASGSAITVERLAVGNAPTEIVMGRTSLDTYASLPDRTTRGRPTQFWLDRQYERPRLAVWPSPDAFHAEAAQIVIWRERHVMDVGAMRQSIEVPRRWYDPVVSVLAYRLALRTAAVSPALIPALKANADEAMAFMGANEKDASPMVLRFGFGGYTR